MLAPITANTNIYTCLIDFGILLIVVTLPLSLRVLLTRETAPFILYSALPSQNEDGSPCPPTHY